MRKKLISDSMCLREYTVINADLNGYGIMHGGRLLTLADETGYLAAKKHSGQHCLTLAVHRARFFRPLFEGQALEFRSQAILAGNTTLWVSVNATEQNAETPAMSAVFVFAAIDMERNLIPMPEIHAQNDEERQLQQHMRKLRSQVREG